MKQKIITSLKIFLFLIPFTYGFAGEKQSSPSQEKVIQVININQATVEELVALPQVGPVTAKRIVEFRTEHKEFKTIEEIMNVKGIGPKKFEKIKDLIKLK